MILKLWEILKSVGSAVLQVALPSTGSLILKSVNEFLPSGNKLPGDATGEQVNNAISSLTPKQQLILRTKDFDVEITKIKESNSTVRAMLESDVKNPHSTRPYIAKGAFLVVAFTIVCVVVIWSYAVVTHDIGLIDVIMNGWSFLLTIIGPLVTLLWAYFGILKQEHRQRLDAANGFSSTAGLLSKFLKRK